MPWRYGEPVEGWWACKKAPTFSSWMAEQRPTIATALCMAVREASHLYLWSLSWGRGRTISVPAVENASLGQLRLASDALFLHGLMVNCLDPELPQYRGWVTCTLQLPEVSRSSMDKTAGGNFRCKTDRFSTKIATRSSDVGWHWAMSVWCLHLRQASWATSWRPSISMDLVRWVFGDDREPTCFSV